MTRNDAIAAVRANPKEPTAWARLGTLLMKDGEDQKATECFMRALRIDGSCEEAKAGLERLHNKDAQEIFEFETSVRKDVERDTRAWSPMTHILLAHHQLTLDEVRALIRPCGMRIPGPGRGETQGYLLKATPAATSEPRLWLLGSSTYSAHLAATKGLPYVFAHHLCAESTAAALETYRREFRPSDLASEPMTFLTVNVAVAPARDEGEDGRAGR